MSDRLVELGEYIKQNSDRHTVTYEMDWIEVRMDGNPAHVKVTEEDDLLVFGWYESDDADMDDCWDAVTFSQVMHGLRTLFSE